MGSGVGQDLGWGQHMLSSVPGEGAFVCPEKEPTGMSLLRHSANLSLLVTGVRMGRRYQQVGQGEGKVWVVAGMCGRTCSRSMQMKPGMVGALLPLGWKGGD